MWIGCGMIFGRITVKFTLLIFEFYSMDVFNRCENGNHVLLAIPGWASVHPLLKVIPMEWEYCIPYGLLHAPEPSETVKRFLSAAQTAMNRCE